MLYGRVIIVPIYFDSVIFFGTDQDKIDEVIKELEDSGFMLTFKDGLYTFLGFEVNTDKQSVKVALTQGGLNKKVLITVGMLDSNKNVTPAATMPLGIVADGSPFGETWECAYFV